MKTKILFTSMVLPTLFAACTAEDLVENQNVSTDLEGRALLNPITVTVSDATPESRFSWNETTGGWNAFSANDKFSAGLVDDAEGTIRDKVLTNFVYSSTDGKSYTTESQMVEGVYMFYSYKGFESSATRGTVDFNLTAQTADLADPTKTVEDNMLFVTPLYDLEAENANDNLNMKFVSYWSTAAIKLKNASDASFKVVRIILNGSFNAKGSLSPIEMNNAGFIYTYDEDKNAFVLDAANAGKEGQKTYNDFLIENIATSTNTSSELVLDCGSYEVKAGEDVMAYMQVPAGKYSDMTTVNVVVETTDSKGKSILKELTAEVVKNAKDKETDAENNRTAMYRGQTTALFGYNEDKTPKALKVDKVALLSAPNADGAYASSFDDVYKYVTEANKADHDAISKALEIYNIGDVKVDDAMVDLLNRMGVVVKFANPIDIELESTSVTTVKNIVFAENVTLKKGKVDFGGALKVEKSLTINEGAYAKISSNVADFSIATIQNNATLELATPSQIAIAQVLNGTEEKNESKVIFSTKQSYYPGGIAEFTEPKYIEIGKDGQFGIGTGLTYTVSYGHSIVNNGIIFGGGGTLVNNGTIENKNTVEVNTLQNVGVAAVSGVSAAKIAIIKNEGTIKSAQLLHDSEVEMLSKTAVITTAVETSTNDQTGKIDNTIGAFVTNTGNDIVYVKYTEDLKDAKLGNVMACNTVYAEGCTITGATTLADGVTSIEFTNVTLSKYVEGVIGNLNFNAATKAILKNCTVDANLTLANTNDKPAEGTTFNGKVTFGNPTDDVLTLKDNTFKGKVILNTSTTTLKLVGGSVEGALDGYSGLTTLNINADGNTAKTTNVAGTITMKSNNANKVDVAEKATLNVSIDGVINIGNSSTNGSITGDGKVFNQGKIVTGAIGGMNSFSDRWVGKDTSES